MKRSFVADVLNKAPWMIIHLFIISFMLLFGCKSNKKSSVGRDPHIVTTMDKNAFESLFNSDSSLLLEMVRLETSPENPFPRLKFHVLDLIHKDTVYKSIETTATIEWYDHDHLKIARIPGTITTDHKPSDHIFILNPRNGSLFKLSDYRKAQNNQEKP